MSADGLAHKEVIRLLKRSAYREVRGAGVSLDLLRRARNSADYDVGLRSPAPEVFNRLRSQLAVASAQTIVDTIRKASASDRRLGIPSRRV